MALTYNTLNSLTREDVIKKVTDNIFNATPLLKWLKGKQKTGFSGTELHAPIEYAVNSNSGWYAGSDTFLTNDVETATKAKLGWKDIYVSVVITGDDKDQNTGRNQVVNLVDYKLKNARKTITKNLTAGLFSDGTGTSSKQLTGLLAAVDDSTNVATYAGISRTDYTWWKAKYTAVSDFISLAAMQSMYGDLTDGEEHPDIIVTTQDVWDDLWELLTPIQRSDSEKLSMNYGFRAISFNGTPVIVDAQCTSGQMFFLNSNYLNLYPLDGYNEPKWSGWKEPTNQDVAVGQLIWKGNLLGTNCRMQGRLVSITT